MDSEEYRNFYLDLQNKYQKREEIKIEFREHLTKSLNAKEIYRALMTELFKQTTSCLETVHYIHVIGEESTKEIMNEVTTKKMEELANLTNEVMEQILHEIIETIYKPAQNA